MNGKEPENLEKKSRRFFSEAMKALRSVQEETGMDTPVSEGGFKELVDGYKKMMDETAWYQRNLSDLIFGKLQQKKTPECMGVLQMLRYLAGHESVVAKFEDHFKSCKDYCQAMVRMVVYSKDQFKDFGEEDKGE